MKAIILNSRCHGGTGQGRWRRLLESPEGQELRESPCFTGGKEELSAWIRERVSSGVRDFIVAGGDGTVHLALNQFFEMGLAQEIRLGAIGIGSSNDFHKPFLSEGRRKIAGFPCRLDFAHARKSDVGSVRIDGSEQAVRFIVNSSVGVTAEANLKFNQGRGMLGFLKKNWTDGAIIAAALGTFAEYENRKLSVSVQGTPARVLDVTNLGLVKNRFFSGSFRYDGPSVPEPDDGTLGFFLCTGMRKGEMFKTLMALSKGKFTGLPKTEHSRGSSFEISGEKPFALETDGEVTLANRASYEVIKEAISLCP